MIIFLSIVLTISVILNIVSYIVINRFIEETQNREVVIENLVPLLANFKDAADGLMSREIYSNDAVVMDFVQRLHDINIYLKNVDIKYDIEENN